MLQIIVAIVAIGVAAYVVPRLGKFYHAIFECSHDLRCTKCYVVKNMLCYRCQSPQPRLSITGKGDKRTMTPMAACEGEGKCQCFCHLIMAAKGCAHSAKKACNDCTECEKNPHCECSVCADLGPFNLMKQTLLEARKANMPKYAKDEFDVVFMGGGIAAIVQAYQLLIHLGQYIRIAIVEPRSPSRMNEQRDLKVGESTVFPSAIFLARDLGLHDYLLENHPPKHGLFYHWAKKSGKTDSMLDYYSTHERGYLHLPSFQLNRAKFERDITELVVARGGVLFQGYANVEAADLASESEPDKFHSVRVTLTDSEEKKMATASEKRTLTLKARHLVDASGRNFLLGRILNCIERGPSRELFNIDNASVWVRVRWCNYSAMMHGTESGDITNRTINSLFYATNHFMGVGHWLWVIPIEIGGAREISIGVAFHRKHFSMDQFDTVEKFYAFLKANHKVLYDICANAELVDWQILNRLVHYSKTVVSKRNLYLVGDAAYNVDPFYSTGIATIAQQVPLMNTVIMGKLSGKRPLAEMNSIADAYNAGLVALAIGQIRTISHHEEHLGNACVMSWRILFEVMRGAGVAAYATGWAQCPRFQRIHAAQLPKANWIYLGIYDTLSEIHRQGINIGFMDYNIPGMAPIFGHAQPLSQFVDGNHEANWLQEAAYEFKRANIHRMVAINSWRTAQLYLTMLWRAWGVKRIFTVDTLQRVAYLVSTSLRARYHAALHDRSMARKKLAPNSERALIQQTFNTYQRPLKAESW